MPTVEQNLQTWVDYDWKQGGDEWSEAWGGTEYLWWGSIFPRILSFVPANAILEIAPGYGRFTQFLLRLCSHLVAVDLTPQCIEACKARFTGQTHITYHVNDGRSLAMIEDGSVDFVFSFDSLVHVEADVIRSYLAQLAGKLRPDGVGFLHHSNLGTYVRDGDVARGFQNPGGRAPSMTANLFERFCTDAGLACVAQEVVNWGGNQLTDCFSVFTKPTSRFLRPKRYRENSGLMAEASILKASSGQYGYVQARGGGRASVDAPRARSSRRFARGVRWLRALVHRPR